MSNIQKHESSAMAVVEEKTLLDYLDTMGLAQTAPASVKKMFLQICQAFQLNPFKRQAYLVGYGQEHRNWSVITGYEQYINRANATERLDGWKVDIMGSMEKNNLSAKLTIWRKDFSHPFEWEVSYNECVAKDRNGNPTPIWKQRPAHMTKKVAIAQGFRLCFPEALEGMPYTSDEMGADTVDIPHQEVKPEKKLANKAAQLTEEQKEEGEAFRQHNKNKTELLLLLNNRHITEEEKEQMISHIDKLTPERLVKAMEKMKETIAEREAAETGVEAVEAEEIAETNPAPVVVQNDTQPKIEKAPESLMQEDPITKEQKGIIERLLTAPEITKEEKDSMKEKMALYSKSRAEKAIKNLQATIKQRRSETAKA